MTIREGKWKCPSCSTVNRGSVQQCAQCGTTRDEKVKFFLDEDAAEVTDAEQLKKAEAGADWVCEFCGNTSPHFATVCTGCGAPPSKKERKHGDVVPVGGPPPAKPTVEVSQPPAQKSSAAPVAIAVMAIALMMCCVCSWFQFRTKTDTASVASAQWQRTIDVEDFLPTEESAWNSAPSGAYKVTHRREQHGTRQVQHGMRTEMVDEKYQSGTKVTGHKDLGNGHFEDVTEPVYSTRKVPKEVPNMVDEPIYEERYYYTIDKWRVVRTDRAKGGAGDAPSWPKVSLKGKEREGSKKELYLISFTSPNAGAKTLRASSQETWSRFKPGSSWGVEWNNAGKFDIVDPQGGAAIPNLAVAGSDDVIQ